jgi:hypothetical protein
MLEKRILVIDIKKYNYFTGDHPNHVSQGVSKIVKFLELTGVNYLLITPDYTLHGKSTFYHYFDNKIKFTNLVDFVDIISDESNLFRLDLIIFDFWHLSKADFWLYKDEISRLNINSFIIAKEYGYSDNEDVSDYSIRIDYRDTNDFTNRSEIWLTDRINKTSSSLNSLRTSYIRDKKIDNIFGDSNDFY